ncbi:MAG: ribonuclease III [Verrucomicrobia bacterium]|nr:ribonuclease III [Verrucomicrobiota bacterium]MBI3870097.1 ribonuclease III [Verrucomicrobiota bacterium]
MADLSELQLKLGYRFHSAELLSLALTHPSVAHETAGSAQHNQRLEFLGDAVLGLVITHELFVRFPGFGEGPLTKARAQLVNRRTLAAQARQLNLGAYLILSRGEELSGGRSRPSALADCFEAVSGAIFLDGGYDQAREFILRCFHDGFGEVNEIPNLDNPKGELQETLQTHSNQPPEYELTSVSGPDHDRLFECRVKHAGMELGRGLGKSKKEAESMAALAALKTLQDKVAHEGE